MKRVLVIVILIALTCIGVPAYAISISDSADGGNKIGFMEDISTNGGSTENMVSFAGNVNASDNVTGNIVAVLGDVTIDSEVLGDVVVIFGEARLTENAVIHGNLVAVGSTDKASAASINGQNISIDIGDFRIGNKSVGFLPFIAFIITAVSTFLVLLMGLPVIAIFSTKFYAVAENSMFNMGRKLAIGFLALVGSFIIMILFSFTIVVPVAYFIILLAAQIIAFKYFGMLVSRLLNFQFNVYAAFITGLVVTAAIKTALVLLIPEDVLLAGLLMSFAIDALINSIGLGIMVDSKFGNKSAV